MGGEEVGGAPDGDSGGRDGEETAVWEAEGFKEEGAWGCGRRGVIRSGTLGGLRGAAWAEASPALMAATMSVPGPMKYWSHEHSMPRAWRAWTSWVTWARGVTRAMAVGFGETEKVEHWVDGGI